MSEVPVLKKLSNENLNSNLLSKDSCEKSKSFTSGYSYHDCVLQREFHVLYLGYAVLDKRYTLPMLPWLVAEIKRRSQPESLELQVTEKTLRALNSKTHKVLFEHLLQEIIKYTQSSRDPACFGYVTGSSAYHVFQARDESTVVDLFHSMRQTSKEMYNKQAQVRTSSGIAFDTIVNSCQQYEVMYLGKRKVPGIRAYPTFIDEGVERFRIQEIERYNVSGNKRERHGSGTSILSLPYSVEKVQLTENVLEVQAQLDSKEDLSGSSGISSCESITHKSADPVDQTHLSLESSIQLACDSDTTTFSSNAQSFIPQSKSMDIVFENLSHQRHNLMPPSSLITHTQSLDSQGCVDTVYDLKDMGSAAFVRDRVRSCSGDISRAKQISLPVYPHRELAVLDSTVRPRAYTSPDSSNSHQTNRTMLFLIGQVEICLIGTDKKQMLFRKTFDDISYCSQGIKYLDHFGFVCRESSSGGGDNYMGYLFRCQTEKVVDEIMQTLKLAFRQAHISYQKLSDKIKKVVICESCPMQWFHKLCLDIDGLTAKEVNVGILKNLSSLSDGYKEQITNKLQSSIYTDIQEQNEILMTSLREFVEQKQLTHSHSLDPKSAKNETIFMKEKSSRLDSFREKAKKSLSTSFETFLKLTARDDGKDSSSLIHFPSKSAYNRDMLSKDVDSRSFREGSCDSGLSSFDQLSPISSRPRSSTFTSIREVQTSGKKLNFVQNFNSTVNAAPKLDMLLKVGSEINDLSQSSFESKGSWRQAIFQQAQTSHSPKPCDSLQSNTDFPSSENESRDQTRKTKEEFRALWKKAIVEQILLIRMEKENKKLQVNQDAVCYKRMKLDYEEITPCINAKISEWEELLNETKEKIVELEREKLINMVKKGVPRHKRGDIWLFLLEYNQMHSIYLSDYELLSYEELLKKLTSHQHSILIDIGRTFPKHPFYSQTLGCGQLSLFNLLKAYSLLDKEVGYCQGLSFVAGILLLHMPEEQAFSTMKYLMFDLGLRRQYKADMVVFQIQMYQLLRLIHDYHKDLYDHFEKFDIAPTLYAAPWFLTLFASQFPISFVSRLFDVLFLHGMDIIFKVSLILLGNYKNYIMKCDSFEATMNFLKTSLPSIDVPQMEEIFTQVFDLEISKQLHAYEIEYHVLVEDMINSPSKNVAVLENLKTSNKKLKAQNMDLMEKLQIAYSRVHQLESSEASLKSTIQRLENRTTALEDQKEVLLYTMKVMKKRLEKLEVVRLKTDSISEGKEHPPPFSVVYAMAGSEREEEEEFKILIQDYLKGRDITEVDENEKLEIQSWSQRQSEENVFDDS